MHHSNPSCNVVSRLMADSYIGYFSTSESKGFRNLHLSYDTEDRLLFLHLACLGVSKPLTTTMDPARLVDASEVHCTVTDDALWRQLIANPDQAACVKQLTVAESGTKDNSVRRQSELWLIQAIHNTKNLDSFTWDCRAPCVSQGDEIPGQTLHTYREDIWTALRDHTLLKFLKVVDQGQGQAHPIFESTVRTRSC